jgi:pimeloyl-ACP methyl ester carboxylesterase
MVERLALVGAALRGFESKPSEATINIYREAARTTPQKAAELWMHNELFAALKNKPKARSRILQMLADNHRAWTTTADGTYDFPKTLSIERLDKITVPTLVIVGAIDYPDLLTIGKVLDEKVPDSELVIMKDASHHPNLEKPKEFNRILRKFLKNNSIGRKK